MQKINLTNEMIKGIESNIYYSKEDFIKDCQTYIKALKSGRLQYRVVSVSKSGMSRDILISSFEGSMIKGYYRNYTSMLEVLGFNFTSKYYFFSLIIFIILFFKSSDISLKLCLTSHSQIIKTCHPSASNVICVILSLWIFFSNLFFQ